MKRILLSVGLLITILFLLASCSTQKVTKLSDGYSKYKGKDFSFEYPSSWQEGDYKQMNQPEVKVYFVDIDAPDAKKFTNSINVTVTESSNLAPSAIETADQTARYMETMGSSQGVSNYKKISFEEVKYEQYNAGVNVASYTISQTGVDAISTQFIIPKMKNTYILTFTTSKDTLAANSETIKRTLASFKIK